MVMSSGAIAAPNICISNSSDLQLHGPIGCTSGCSYHAYALIIDLRVSATRYIPGITYVLWWSIHAWRLQAVFWTGSADAYESICIWWERERWTIYVFRLSSRRSQELDPWSDPGSNNIAFRDYKQDASLAPTQVCWCSSHAVLAYRLPKCVPGFAYLGFLFAEFIHAVRWIHYSDIVRSIHFSPHMYCIL